MLCISNTVGPAAPVNVKFAPTIYNVSEGDGYAVLTLMSDSPVVDMNYTVKVITQDRKAMGKYIYVRMFVCMYIGTCTYACTLVATSKRLMGCVCKGEQFGKKKGP